MQYDNKVCPKIRVVCHMCAKVYYNFIIVQQITSIIKNKFFNLARLAL